MEALPADDRNCDGIDPALSPREYSHGIARETFLTPVPHLPAEDKPDG